MHLWWWEEDHAPGRTAEEARKRLADAAGMAPEECGALDEWVMVPDDDYIRDEDGSIPIPARTAAQYAADMARNWDRLAAAPPSAAPRTAPETHDTGVNAKRRLSCGHTLDWSRVACPECFTAERSAREALRAQLEDLASEVRRALSTMQDPMKRMIKVCTAGLVEPACDHGNLRALAAALELLDRAHERALRTLATEPRP